MTIQRRNAARLASLALGAVLAACGPMVDPAGSSADARASDARATDAVAPDSDPTDAITSDAAVADGALDDAPATADAATSDTASPTDASGDDGAALDAGRDAGSPMDSGVDGGAAPAHTCPASLPRYDLRADFHAVGDGRADDTDALHAAAVAIQSAGGGELLIPPGTYRVGRQAAGAMAGQPYFRPAPMFSVDGVSCLQVSGYGATLRLTAGLHYGAFSATSPTPVPGPTTSPTARADVGRMIDVSNSSHVLIEGLELDGNNTTLVLGGQWGDVDRQTRASGIVLNQDHDALVMDVHTHHHGLDGIAVEYLNGPPPSRMPQVLVRVNSEYNGRQGISWIGGWGLSATDCQFNHTGRAINHGGGMDDGMPLSSAPRAGIDIEPNGGTTEMSRDGQFTRCEFVDNAGAGLDAAVGDGGYSTFTDCTFWGTTSYSAWANRPGLRFVGSRFYGTLARPSNGATMASAPPVPSLAASFDGCTFEDRPWTDGRVYRSGNLVNLNTGEGDGVTWHNCTFVNHAVRAIYDADATTHEVFDACTFRFDNNGLAAGSYQTYFSGSTITSTHFTETTGITHDYDIRHPSVVVGAPAPGAPGTVVDGPHVTWGGRTGTIPPG